MTTKLTPALSAEARRLFAAEWVEYNGWQPGGTCKRVAAALGLTVEQVQTSCFGASKAAVAWRTRRSME